MLWTCSAGRPAGTDRRWSSMALSRDRRGCTSKVAEPSGRWMLRRMPPHHMKQVHARLEGIHHSGRGLVEHPARNVIKQMTALHESQKMSSIFGPVVRSLTISSRLGWQGLEGTSIFLSSVRGGARGTRKAVIHGTIHVHCGAGSQARLWVNDQQPPPTRRVMARARSADPAGDYRSAACPRTCQRPPTANDNAPRDDDEPQHGH
jgi:hypothetical protein